MTDITPVKPGVVLDLGHIWGGVFWPISCMRCQSYGGVSSGLFPACAVKAIPGDAQTWLWLSLLVNACMHRPRPGELS